MNSQPQIHNTFSINPELPRPMFKMALSFMGGILYARYFPLGLSAALGMTFLIAIIWSTLGRKEPVRQTRSFHWVMAALLTFMLGGLRMEYLWLSWQNHQDQVAQQARWGNQTIHGNIIEKRTYTSGLHSLLLNKVRLEKYSREHNLPVQIELRGYREELAHALPGDVVQADGWLFPVRGPYVPTTMDFQEYRYSQNIFGSFFVPNDGQCIVQSGQSPTTARGFAHTLQQRIQHQWREHPRGEDIIGLMGSIALGIRSQMPDDLRKDLQNSGLAHITSISGLHVSLVLVLTFLLLKKIGMKRRYAGIVMSLFALAYLNFVGIRIPTLRAVLMAYVGIGGMMLQREADSLNTLGIVALLILWAEPAELFLPSFQLSFAAVLVLILSQRWSSVIYKKIKNAPIQYTFNSLIASFAVVIGIAPFTIYYFHTFAWGAILANLIAIPILALFLPITYFYSLASLFSLPYVTDFFATLTQYCAIILLEIIHFFGSSSWFHFSVVHPSSVTLILSFIAILLLFRPMIVLCQSKSIRFYSFHIALLLFALGLWLPVAMSQFKPLRVDFLALGQGDCILIRTPNNHTMLIDGGPTPRGREDTLLMEYFMTQGIEHIDAMALTHPQSDHIGALPIVARQLPVGVFVEGTPGGDHKRYQSLIDILNKKKVKKIQVTKGTHIQLDSEVSVWVLHPAYRLQKTPSEINEQSLVLLLQYRDIDLLLTGDIGAATERFLCSIYDHWDVEMLKVAHHGSKNSTTEEFLAETRPEFAVIQVGNNRYGHPHDETRYRLYDISSHVLRTDYDGSIQLRTWGHSLQIYATRRGRFYKMNIPN